MLPFLYALREQGTRTEYSHLLSYWGITEFLDTLPHGRKTYEDALKEMMLTLYAASSKGDCKYFLDKTPRYHTISEEIVEIFGSEGKFIFLWRHPLAIAASILKTWDKKGWNLYLHKVDLYQGIDALIMCYQKNKDSSFAVRYEDLVGLNSSEMWARLFDYLEMEFKEEYLTNFAAVVLNGAMGDKSGVKKYKELDSSSLNAWKSILNNPLRKLWADRYLKWLGRERLAVIGYDYDQLRAELKSMPMSWSNVFQDAFMMMYGEMRCIFSLRVIRGKLSKIGRPHEVLNEEY
jgi:hypothetical protein